MTADQAIAMLNGQLALHGEDTVLRRIYGQAGNIAVVDVGVRARVNAFSETELVGGIAETDSKVVMSPSEIAAAQWPGGELPSLTVPNPSLPRRNDKLVVNGRARNIEFVNPVSIGAALVRIELRISG